MAIKHTPKVERDSCAVLTKKKKKEKEKKCTCRIIKKSEEKNRNEKGATFLYASLKERGRAGVEQHYPSEAPPKQAREVRRVGKTKDEVMHCCHTAEERV